MFTSAVTSSITPSAGWWSHCNDNNKVSLGGIWLSHLFRSAAIWITWAAITHPAIGDEKMTCILIWSKVGHCVKYIDGDVPKNNLQWDKLLFRFVCEPAHTSDSWFACEEIDARPTERHNAALRNPCFYSIIWGKKVVWDMKVYGVI